MPEKVGRFFLVLDGKKYQFWHFDDVRDAYSCFQGCQNVERVHIEDIDGYELTLDYADYWDDEGNPKPL